MWSLLCGRELDLQIPKLASPGWQASWRTEALSQCHLSAKRKVCEHTMWTSRGAQQSVLGNHLGDTEADSLLGKFSLRKRKESAIPGDPREQTSLLAHVTASALCHKKGRKLY